MVRRAAISSAFSRRFASPAARFRCAVAAGFVVAAVAVGSVAGGGIGRADDMFSALGSLFGGGAPQYGYGGMSGGSLSFGDYAPRHRRQPRTARRHPGAPHAALKLAAVHDGTAQPGQRSVCVRLCDGFAFPVGSYGGSADRAPHEAACRAECPGARTALYLLPNGSDTLKDAVDARFGDSYSRIPAAFRFTGVVDESCSCHPRGTGRTASLLHDFTLRRGDAVMTASGVKVFHGGHLPYRPTDFVTLERSRDVASGRRATFHAIERASLSAPASAARLQKQASLNP